jgi:hypothetical protein
MFAVADLRTRSELFPGRRAYEREFVFKALDELRLSEQAPAPITPIAQRPPSKGKIEALGRAGEGKGEPLTSWYPVWHRRQLCAKGGRR